ncbi:histidine kinase [Chryseobacterium sp. FH1]|nr:histidine kinase [Chryseobacterium sp. FH1]
MFRTTFLLLVLLLLGNVCKAQQLIPIDESRYLDQIDRNIKSGKDQGIILQNYLLLSEYWAPSDSLKSVQALNKVLNSPKKDVLSPGLLDYYQGIFSTHQGSKADAAKFYGKAIKQLQDDPENKGVLIRALYNQAYVQIEDRGYDLLVKALTEKCIPLSEKANNTELLAYCYTQLGLTFMSVGQFDKAEEYHNKALSQLKKLPADSSVRLITYLNIVSNYCYRPDSKTAKVYLDKAKAMVQHYPDSQHYANYYYQEAMYHTTREDYPKALGSLDAGIRLAKAKKQFKILHLLYFRMYNVYLMQKDYLKARQQLELVLKENVLGKEANNRRVTYTQLAAVNDVLGRHKEAYHWMKRSNDLGDSLNQQKLVQKMNEYEILHKTSEKQKTINRLEKDKKESELMSKNKNLRITILAIALGLILIIAILIYLTYRKQQKLNQQVKISHQLDLLHMENEKRYEATKAVLQGEEQERQRIAQDLHDSMGGMLANIRMSISSNEAYRATDIVEKIDRSISEMRRISRNLMPETLKNLGLETALKELCESMTHKHLSIQFEAFGVSDNIPFPIQLALYRIAQESISNVIKYAQANNVIVQISQDGKTLALTVEDDGVGFDRSRITYGLGLRNIENRARLMNGKVDIHSEKGEGTTINVECHV